MNLLVLKVTLAIMVLTPVLLSSLRLYRQGGSKRVFAVAAGIVAMWAAILFYPADSFGELALKAALFCLLFGLWIHYGRVHANRSL
jgi:hypothetical protein